MWIFSTTECFCCAALGSGWGICHGSEPQFKVATGIRHLVLALGKNAQDVEKSPAKETLDMRLQRIVFLGDVRK